MKRVWMRLPGSGPPLQPQIPTSSARSHHLGRKSPSSEPTHDAHLILGGLRRLLERRLGQPLHTPEPRKAQPIPIPAHEALTTSRLLGHASPMGSLHSSRVIPRRSIPATIGGSMPPWLSDLIDAASLLPLIVIAVGVRRRGSHGRATEAFVMSQTIIVSYPVAAYAGLIEIVFAYATSIIAIVLAVHRWRSALAEVVVLVVIMFLFEGRVPPDRILILGAAFLAAGWLRVLMDADERSEQQAARAAVIARNQERAKIVRTLHDSIGQKLAALRITLEMLEDCPGLVDDETARGLLTRSHELTGARSSAPAPSSTWPLKWRPCASRRPSQTSKSGRTHHSSGLFPTPPSPLWPRRCGNSVRTPSATRAPHCCASMWHVHRAVPS